MGVSFKDTSQCTRLPMYTLSDKSQIQAQAINEGRQQLAPVHMEIVNWISKQFGVKALDFYCEARQSSKRQLFHLIIETDDDVRRLQSDSAASNAIVERFTTYLKSVDSHNLSDPLKSDVLPSDTKPFPKVIVTYRPFTGVSSEILNEMLNEDQRAVLKTFETVWTMSMNVIFYYTDEQMKANQENGTSKRISDELAQVDRKYGFKPTTTYRFDSKEYFDRDCKGDWHHYWA
jgi:hypothetical protein